MDGTLQYIWPDATGVLRIGTTNPTNAQDTSGNVVGAQTSRREAKNVIRRSTNRAGALAAIVATPVYDFTYKSGSYDNQQFTGVVIEPNTSPWFGMDNNKVLNPVSTTGYFILAIQELTARLEKLEADAKKK